VYNYTRDFPFIWEEMSTPIAYKDDHQRAEEILLNAARRYALSQEKLPQSMLDYICRQYLVNVDDLTPRVFYRLTDNWLELTVRFLVSAHGVREVKDAMSRGILTAFEAAKMGIASATFEIVGLPPVQVHSGNGRADSYPDHHAAPRATPEEAYRP
jgi:small-conductance mechanosensitive channel